MDTIFSRVTKRQVIVTIAVIVALAFVFIIVNLVRNRPLPVSGTLAVSDTVIANVENAAVLSGQVAYFTGSNQALLTNTRSGGSRSVFSETAFESPRRSTLDSNGENLLVSVNYSGTSDFFQIPGAEPGIRWVVAQKDSGKVTLVQPFSEQILDATIQDGVVYGLRLLTQSTTELFSYTINDGSYKQLNESIGSNSVVGVTESSVVTRTSEGDIHIYSTDGKEVANIGTVGSAYLDQKTGSLIISDNRQDSTRYKVAVFNAKDGKKKWDVRGEYKNVSVSNGYVALFDANVQPDFVVLYNLDTKQGTKYGLEYTNERNTSAIASIVVVDGPSTELMFATSSNELLYVDKDTSKVAGIPSFSYPTVRAPEDSGVFFESRPGSLDLVIIAETSRLQDSVALLTRNCGCNQHEFRKTWRSIEEYNRPAETRSDDYTGDGVPPELQ